MGKNRDEGKYIRLIITAFLSFLVGKTVPSLPDNLFGLMVTILLLAALMMTIILSCSNS